MLTKPPCQNSLIRIFYPSVLVTDTYFFPDTWPRPRTCKPLSSPGSAGFRTLWRLTITRCVVITAPEAVHYSSRLMMRLGWFSPPAHALHKLKSYFLRALRARPVRDNEVRELPSFDIDKCYNWPALASWTRWISVNCLAGRCACGSTRVVLSINGRMMRDRANRSTLRARPLYGGTERVVSYLTEELVRQGHQVTLFATEIIITSAKLVPCTSRALRLDPSVRDPIPYHMLMLDKVRQRADQFDVLHFHIDYLHFPLFRSESGTGPDDASRQARPCRSLPFYLASRKCR